jgi:iron complex outermembrane receptor protein
MGWALTEQVRLSFEARYNRDNADYRASGWRIEDTTLLGLTPRCDPSQAQGVRLAPTEVNACEQTAEHRSRQFTPRATAEYRWNPSGMAYLTFAGGFKPGGYETLEISTFEGRRFLPEKLRTWEAGAKTDWLDGRLIANGAVFWNDYTDQQIGIQQINPETGFAGPRIVNAGRVEVRGLELGADWRSREGLTLGLSYAYTDAEFAEFVMGPGAPPAGASPAEFEAVFEACGVPAGQTSSPIFRVEAGNDCADFSGNQVGRSPRHALNGSAEFRRTLTAEGLAGFVQYSSVYRSRRFTDESNLAWLPSYSLGDAQVGIQGRQWTVTGFVNNVFDNRRIQNAQRNIDLGRPDGFAPGRAFNAYLPSPRRFGVRLEATMW